MSRVAIIGAGPSGLCMLYHLERLKRLHCNQDLPIKEVVCYEKQAQSGGLWNYDWNTGVDSNGEPVHGTMYRTLWTNSCKEASLEFPDYTFMDHWGRPVPSYLTRGPVKEYLHARMAKMNVEQHIKFSHIIKNITYHPEESAFSVIARDVDKNIILKEKEFDYVINATGHFSTPNKPYFQGIESFPGRVLHSGEFRNPKAFSGQDVLVIAAGISGEDIALSLIKYGANHVTITHKPNKPGNITQFPKGIILRPLLTHINKSEVIFPDGYKASFNSIILCTGYKHHYPHLPDSLKLRNENVFYPDQLYKGTLFIGGADNRLFYMGTQQQLYTWSMFDCQATWIAQVLNKFISLPSTDKMRDEIDLWRDREVASTFNIKDKMHFQTDYIVDLAEAAGYDHDMDSRDHFLHLFKIKFGTGEGFGPDVYRNCIYTSKFTGVTSVKPAVDFMNEFEEDNTKFMEPYLKKEGE